MNYDEAYRILGISQGSSRAMIRAAFLTQAKSAHPDIHGGGTNAHDRFQYILDAYEVLKHRGVPMRITADPEAATEAVDDATRVAPVKIVRAFLQREGVSILFDGTLQRDAAPRMATSPQDVAAFLAIEEVDHAWLADEIMLDIAKRSVKCPKADIDRAIRKVVRDDRRRRRQTIATPLFVPVTVVEAEVADTIWQLLGEIAFDTDTDLTVACLKHFIWQVKRKLIGLPVTRHLMPIVWSAVQGSGKTTFVLRFLQPLYELATGPVLLSDFSDRRSGDLFRFPVLFIDDMERIDRAAVPILKSLVTSSVIRRRRLGTSLSEGLRQATTLIGTANQPVSDLVADETGHRRFASLRFRNGEVTKGGDPTVWQAVDALDATLLWRSVNAHGDEPIGTHLDALVALQDGGRPVDPLLAWLRSLDLDSEAVKSITTKDGIPASELFELFCKQTGQTITSSRFGMDMVSYAVDPSVPFAAKIKTEKRNLYPIKRGVRQKTS